MNLKSFVTAAVEGNRELRGIGLSQISDKDMESLATKMAVTMTSNRMNLAQYIAECDRRNS